MLVKGAAGLSYILNFSTQAPEHKADNNEKVKVNTNSLHLNYVITDIENVTMIVPN